MTEQIRDPIFDRMKIPTPEGLLIDLTAPVVAANAVRYMGGERWFMWCEACREWHTHGPGEGHREARCSGETQYTATGYNLALAGMMTRSVADMVRRRRRGDSFTNPSE